MQRESHLQGLWFLRGQPPHYELPPQPAHASPLPSDVVCDGVAAHPRESGGGLENRHETLSHDICTFWSSGKHEMTFTLPVHAHFPLEESHLRLQK